MKKLISAIAAISAALLMGASAFAEGYINANDLTPASITEDLAAEDGFVIHGTAEKFVLIDSSDPAKAGDDVFTQRINLKGSGKADVRSVTFPAKKGETITIYAASSSKTDARTINVANEAGEVVKEVSVKPYTDGVTVDSFKAPADGTYAAYSAKNSMYIYQITVAK